MAPKWIHGELRISSGDTKAWMREELQFVLERSVDIRDIHRILKTEGPFLPILIGGHERKTVLIWLKDSKRPRGCVTDHRDEEKGYLWLRKMTPAEIAKHLKESASSKHCWSMSRRPGSNSDKFDDFVDRTVPEDVRATLLTALFEIFEVPPPRQHAWKQSRVAAAPIYSSRGRRIGSAVTLSGRTADGAPTQGGLCVKLHGRKLSIYWLPWREGDSVMYPGRSAAARRLQKAIKTLVPKTASTYTTVTAEAPAGDQEQAS